MIDSKRIFSGMRVTVMGLGLLGRGLLDTMFLVKSGAKVTVTDLKDAEQLKESLRQLEGLPIRFVLGKHDESDFINTDMVLRNADVPKSSSYLRIAADKGIPIEMDESLFCKHFKGKVVGITGTRGKTTTTMLSHLILSEYLNGVHLGGNIQNMATLPLLDKAEDEDIVVLELSSWQLQGFHADGMSPNVGVFTNIYPDHLNRYSGMQEYIDDKKAIFLYQKPDDTAIFNAHQPDLVEMSSTAPGKKLFFERENVPSDWEIAIPGVHNRENIAAAMQVAQQFSVPQNVMKSVVENFRGVEHRLQNLGEKNGVRFINDSTSTTPVAGCAALNSIQANRILLIAGGSDKKLDLTPFAKAVAERSAAVALLSGTATENLAALIGKQGAGDKILGIHDNLRAAVFELLNKSRPGDVIMLSPGCASFGMFLNEYHRGNTFIEIVNEILN